MEQNYSKVWAVTLRELLSKQLNFPIDNIFRQGQNGNPVNPDEFISYSLLSEKSEDTAYTCDFKYRVNYELTYVLSFYGRYPNELARELLKKLRLQTSKDILQPRGMAVKSAQVIGNLTESVGNKVYNRTDVTLILSAIIVEQNPEFIDKVNIEFCKE